MAAEWGIDKVLWGREWQTLSGGEGQRLALAIAIGIGGAEVVLLDGKYCSFIPLATLRVRAMAHLASGTINHA